MNKQVFPTINAFLEHCCENLQYHLGLLGSVLDSSLTPRIFLFAMSGILEDFHYAPPILEEVVNCANDEIRPAVESNVVSVELSSALFQAVMKKHVIANLPEGFETFPSSLFQVEDIRVFALCTVKADPIATRHQLSKKNKAVCSLITGAIDEFLEGVPGYVNASLDPLKMLYSAPFPSTHEILRNTAKKLVTRISFHLPPVRSIESSIPVMRESATFFDDLNQLSRMKYESDTAIGSIVVATKGHPNVDILIEFTYPVPTQNHRVGRKLLEISDGELSLLYDKGRFYGLGRITGDYKLEREDMFRITINGHYLWTLHHGSHQMFVMDYEQAKLYADEQDDYLPVFRAKLTEVFSEVDDTDVQQLMELLTIAIKQPHGTMLAIVDNASDEAARLRNQSTNITPIKISRELMNKVTSIDGAVLLDPKGTCYSIGAILDGEMPKGLGNPGRGARYNSALKYISRCKGEANRCVLVVISEDGMVDILDKSVMVHNTTNDSQSAE